MTKALKLSLFFRYLRIKPNMTFEEFLNYKLERMTTNE